MKKDTNYIAAVEKAISEKYGKETVQDFRSAWTSDDEEEYLKQLKKITQTTKSTRKKEKIETDSLVISRYPIAEKIKRSCPVCKTYSFSSRDDLYMKRFECCFACYVDFIEHRQDEWDKGYRPNLKELSHAIVRRNKKNV